MSWTSRLKEDSRSYSRKHYYDEEKQQAFIDGACWAVTKLYRALDVHPMEEQAGAKAFCDKFRLKDFAKCLDELTKPIKVVESAQPEQKKGKSKKAALKRE